MYNLFGIPLQPNYTECECDVMIARSGISERTESCEWNMWVTTVAADVKMHPMKSDRSCHRLSVTCSLLPCFDLGLAA